MQTEVIPTKADGEAASQPYSQYLTFIMNNEEYGVDILCVQEIRGWEATTSLPNSPAHVKGVINLRGAIVPIIDLRECFGLDAVEYNSLTVVIVLQVKSDAGSRVMGIIVDGVSDVYTLSSQDIHNAPDLGGDIDAQCIQGLACVEDSMVVILDTDKLLSIEEPLNMDDLKRALGSKV